MLEDKVAPRMNEFSEAWEYELLEDVEFEHDGETIVVPKYFSYDGATIPSLAWQAIYTPFDPIVMTPALVHDWLYANHQVGKAAADRVLRKLLLDNGAPAVKVELIYRGVEFFGRAAWKNTADDLKYLRWLRNRLTDEGIDVRKYHFPPGLDS